MERFQSVERKNVGWECWDASSICAKGFKSFIIKLCRCAEIGVELMPLTANLTCEIEMFGDPRNNGREIKVAFMSLQQGRPSSEYTIRFDGALCCYLI